MQKYFAAIIICVCGDQPAPEPAGICFLFCSVSRQVGLDQLWLQLRQAIILYKVSANAWFEQKCVDILSQLGTTALWPFDFIVQNQLMVFTF